MMRKFVSGLMQIRAELADSSSRGDGVRRCREILDNLICKGRSTPVGWCTQCTLKPNKEDGGYVQLSAEGFNKGFLLHEVLLWSTGREKPDPLHDPFKTEISHLCGNPRCMIGDHICLEPQLTNNSRKGCRTALDCSPNCSLCGGSKVILQCTHEPMCITYNPRYTSFQDMLNNVCGDQRDMLRALDANLKMARRQ
jgi:hypothetical protein